MNRSSKKIGLIILLVIFVIEIAFFSLWVVNYGGGEKLERLFSSVVDDVLFWNVSPEGKDLEVFSENISEVNEAIAQSLVTVPQALKNELANSRLYFMLANKLGGYTRSFSFEDGKFNASINERRSDLFFSYSPNGEKVVFLALPEGVKVVDGLNWGELAQVYTADKSAVVAGFPNMEDAQQVTDASFPYKQFPSISNGGEVLFNVGDHVAHRETEEAEDFGVYHIDGSTLTLLMKGFQPQWVSDTEFLVLKNDGMHRSLADGSASTLIIPKPAPTPVHKNEKFDISADGTTIAWTMPGEEKIFIYTKNQLGEYILSSTVAIKGLQPEFSPSGAFLTLYTVTTNGEQQSQQIEFYETDTFTKVPELQIPLDDFNPRAVFITEWVSK